MKLYERLPDSVVVDGKRIKCDFDFRNVLKMLWILSRDDLTDEARVALAAGCISKLTGEYAAGIVREAAKVLFGKSDKGAKTHERSGNARSVSRAGGLGSVHAAVRRRLALHRLHERLSAPAQTAPKRHRRKIHPFPRAAQAGLSRDRFRPLRGPAA